MAYKIDCNCDSCQQMREDAGDEYFAVVDDILTASGVDEMLPEGDSSTPGTYDFLAASLTDQLMVAAGFEKDFEPHTGEQAEDQQELVKRIAAADRVRRLDADITSEATRLGIIEQPNILPFKRRNA